MLVFVNVVAAAAAAGCRNRRLLVVLFPAITLLDVTRKAPDDAAEAAAADAADAIEIM
eukprot:CAMPEP_0171052868 /NCGR_PEP_ID=MMETSP0736-20130129/54103_2 /TAXON_ID=186038 /ORGANISM="Fragilariopsis kerguelensis, Strain L26-C5" /LENGTH=57 /DNA_ID=CAMNT_0011506615 /DNA_START=365 /DNA_END=535 /DNA_ORIENTATION=-